MYLARPALKDREGERKGASRAREKRMRHLTRLFLSRTKRGVEGCGFRVVSQTVTSHTETLLLVVVGRRIPRGR